VLLATFSLSIYLKRQEIAFDEDEQTAQDYSIVIVSWDDHYSQALLKLRQTMSEISLFPAIL
jgi:hypothetical protein